MYMRIAACFLRRDIPDEKTAATVESFTGVIIYALCKSERDPLSGQWHEPLSGLKEQYIRVYGNAYEVNSPRNRELTALFHNTCERYGIWHDNSRIFRYMNTLEVQEDQLTFF